MSLPPDLANIVTGYKSLDDLIADDPAGAQEILEAYDNDYPELGSLNRELSSYEADVLEAHLLLGNDAPTMDVEFYSMLPENVRILMLVQLYPLGDKMKARQYIDTEFSREHEGCVPEIISANIGQMSAELIGDIIRVAKQYKCPEIFEILEGLRKFPQLLDVTMFQILAQNNVPLPIYEMLLRSIPQFQLDSILLKFPSFLPISYLEAVLKAGADPNVRDSGGRTLLMTGFNQLSAYLRLLIQYGADVNARDNKDNTPLMHAAERTSDYNVKLLLDHGADPTLRNKRGESVIQIAHRTHNPVIFKMLVRNGADSEGLQPPLGYTRHRRRAESESEDESPAVRRAPARRGLAESGDESD